MKHLFLFLLIVSSVLNTHGQNFSLNYYGERQPLDLNSPKTWYTVSGGSISNDGKYLYYYVSNKPVGTTTLIIKSTNNDWQKEYVACSAASFTPDNKYIIFKLGTDSLNVLKLGTSNVSFLATVSNFKIAGDDHTTWLGFITKGPKGDFILLNLSSSKAFQVQDAYDCFFGANNKEILIATTAENKGQQTHILKLLHLPDLQSREIWSSPECLPVNYSFDSQGSQLVFLTRSINAAKPEFEVWYYKDGNDSSSSILNSTNIDSNWKISYQTPFFSKDGSKLFFGQIKKEVPTQIPVASNVEVWNYMDKQLQSVQLEEIKKSRTYTSVYSFADKKIIKLENENERIMTIGNEFALIIHELGSRGQFEAYWNAQAEFSYSLESLTDGQRKLLRDKVKSYDGGVSISPNWKWAVYYDFNTNDFFSINIETGRRINVTKHCPTSWIKSENAYPMPSLTGWPIWVDNDRFLLLYDNYDVWKIDPTGEKIPENLTNGYGKKYHIKFEVLNNDELQERNNSFHSYLLLKAFNKDNKETGFFKKNLGISGNPERLFMGPYVFGQWNGYGSYNYPPIKAKDTNAYIVIRMKDDEAPNYFFTNDFKIFNAISDLQPQKFYNWYTTELHTWKSLDGSILQGILYKPQNFDSTKKYPLIFDYYERRSDELNLFITPKASEGRINIPLFVSNGYLVFVPDIKYKVGWPGISAYQSVVSAANYLKKFKWIDGKRMGLQGHSFAGYETNFIITKSHLFAAACSASGFCDLMSAYNSAARGGFPMFAAEKGQNRLGATPWHKPELYIQNSPIYGADKITTPLLLMNNKNDYVVPFSQGLEFFVALRRLSKKVWMLQYDNGGHEVDGIDAEDFHKRMKQFFDHFLKDKPAPLWMTRGVEAKNKTIESGLEFDTKDNQLKSGLDSK
jgi:hypothetical protein